jgi:hypothetical protein
MKYRDDNFEESVKHLYIKIIGIFLTFINLIIGTFIIIVEHYAHAENIKQLKQQQALYIYYIKDENEKGLLETFKRNINIINYLN